MTPAGTRTPPGPTRGSRRRSAFRRRGSAPSRRCGSPCRATARGASPRGIRRSAARGRSRSGCSSAPRSTPDPRKRRMRRGSARKRRFWITAWTTAGIARGGDNGARILRRRGERLLGQDMTAVAQRGEHDLAARRRHHDVEDDIRPRLGKHGVEVAADHGFGDPELFGALPRPLSIDVDESDDLRAGFARGLEPCLAHCAATNKNRAYQRSPSLPGCRRRTGGALHGGRPEEVRRNLAHRIPAASLRFRQHGARRRARVMRCRRQLVPRRDARCCRTAERSRSASGRGRSGRGAIATPS